MMFIDIYIGGNFTGVANKTTTTINDITYVAQYNIKDAVWNSLKSVRKQFQL